jgi:hypothetical protein
MKILWLLLFTCCLIVGTLVNSPWAGAANSPTPTPCPTSTSPLSTAVPC